MTLAELVQERISMKSMNFVDVVRVLGLPVPACAAPAQPAAETSPATWKPSGMLRSARTPFLSFSAAIARDWSTYLPWTRSRSTTPD